MMDLKLEEQIVWGVCVDMRHHFTRGELLITVLLFHLNFLRKKEMKHLLDSKHRREQQSIFDLQRDKKKKHLGAKVVGLLSTTGPSVLTGLNGGRNMLG